VRRGVPPCRAAAGWRLAGRRGARSSHILVEETGSSETWHRRLGPRITHRHLLLDGLKHRLSRRRWCWRWRRLTPAAPGATTGMPSGLSSPAASAAGIAGIWAPNWPPRGGSEDPIQSGPPRRESNRGGRKRLSRRDLPRFLF
jgi:hypothetical protein